MGLRGRHPWGCGAARAGTVRVDGGTTVMARHHTTNSADRTFQSGVESNIGIKIRLD